MAKEICISSTPHETRLAILEDDQLAEIYYERENEYTLAGSIYKGRVTRVLPGMQSAFVDLGLERDAFLYVTDFLEEQEDGADFEHAGSAQSSSNGGGNGPSRREGGQQREQRPRQEAAPRPQTAPRAEAAPREDAAGDPEGSDDSESASGTRRWRGRRGRRRGFRGRNDQDQSQSAQPGQPAEQGHISEPIDEPEEVIAIEPQARPERSERGHSDSRRGSGERQSSERQSGERSSGRNGGGAPASSTPILLPGESLSRYGASPAAAASTSEAKPEAKPQPVAGINYVAPKPSTLIEVPLGWDGGALLPGETLSRYRRNEAARTAPQEVAASVTEPVSEAQEPVHEPVQAAENLSGEESREEAVAASELSAAPVAVEASFQTLDIPAEPETQAQTETVVVEAAAEIPAPEAAVEAAPQAVQEAPAPVELPAAEQVYDEVEEIHEEEVQEFEPESGSASYRIDPAPPSEFRVSTPFEEELAPTAPDSHEHETHEHTIPEIEAPVTAAAPAEAETEAAEPEVAAEVPAEELLHAQPVATPEAETPEAETVDQLYGFAPGLGVLEEEVIEEEEYEFEPIHGQSDEQEEDLEEETLDHAGDIGDAVRDAHLDQRLGLGTPVEGIPGEDESDEDELDESEDESGLDIGFVEEVEDEDEEFDEQEEGEEEDGAHEGHDHEGHDHAEAPAGSPEAAAPQRREGQRDGGRRGGRSGGRGREQQVPGRRRPGGGGGRRQSAQTMDLPIISDMLKQGQEILVQIAKEPIAKKGARITSHIALPGRFLVFMPTVNHVGVSRKISSDEERQRLKRILTHEKGTESGGFIVRTAADGTSEEELRADLRFLLNLWKDIRQRADDAKAPALIYHDLNLVERILRDQVSDNFSTIWVDSEVDYERIVRFLNRFQPSLVRRVKLYTKETPLFEHFGIQEEIGKALKSKVWLKSGGSIVINQTEALVAIDINTGKYVGKTARLEDTIVKTNLDAIPEIVRQIRLRDLGGIIVIDFIDMDERKNRHRVLAALEEELKNDRAPSKVLQFNDFGLVAITRKRVKQSLERTLSIPCPTCTATGMVKSPLTVANEIYTEMRRMQKHFDRNDVMLRVNPEVVKTLKAGNGKWLNELEEMTGKTIIVKSDPALHPEQFDIH
jgi:ribonuclease E